MGSFWQKIQNLDFSTFRDFGSSTVTLLLKLNDYLENWPTNNPKIAKNSIFDEKWTIPNYWIEISIRDHAESDFHVKITLQHAFGTLG